MRELKFSYIYKHDETGELIDLRYTLDAIEKGEPARDKNHHLNKYSLVARRQYIGLKDSKGLFVYEGDIVEVIGNIYKNPELLGESDARN